mmetsp:Transcript_7160/g.22909  ORF Transcript_7160/g.22909 Transcript_7160/m.22909 type:complete len:300 (+) Transcript_7160:714-1613(+)
MSESALTCVRPSSSSDLPTKPSSTSIASADKGWKGGSRAWRRDEAALGGAEVSEASAPAAAEEEEGEVVVVVVADVGDDGGGAGASVSSFTSTAFSSDASGATAASASSLASGVCAASSAARASFAAIESKRSLRPSSPTPSITTRARSTSSGDVNCTLPKPRHCSFRRSLCCMASHERVTVNPLAVKSAAKASLDTVEKAMLYTCTVHSGRIPSGAFDGSGMSASVTPDGTRLRMPRWPALGVSAVLRSTAMKKPPVFWSCGRKRMQRSRHISRFASTSANMDGSRRRCPCASAVNES